MPWKRRRLSELQDLCDKAIQHAGGRFTCTQRMLAHHRVLRRKDDRAMVTLLASALTSAPRIPTTSTMWPADAATLTKKRFLSCVRSLVGHFQTAVSQRRRRNALARHLPLKLNLKARTLTASVPHLLFASRHTDRLPAVLRPFLLRHGGPTLGVDVIVVPWLLRDRVSEWTKAGFSPHVCTLEEARTRRLPKLAHTRFVTTTQLLSSNVILQDVVICEDIKRWTLKQKLALATRRCRGLVVGGWSLNDGSSKSPLSVLPYATNWTEKRILRMVSVAADIPVCQRCAPPEPLTTFAGHKAAFPEGSHARLVGALVEHLVRLCAWDGSHNAARGSWQALRDARHCALQEEGDARVRETIALVVDWCTRLVSCDIALASRTAEETWRALVGVWGPDAPQVCPRCAVVVLGTSHDCTWDGRQVFVPEVAELGCLLLDSRLEDGYSNTERRLIFRRLASRETHLPNALGSSSLSPSFASWIGWHSGLLTLRAWCSAVEMPRRASSLCLEDARGAAAHAGQILLSTKRPTVACSLVIMGAASFQQCWREHEESTTYAAQTRGDIVVATPSEASKFARASARGGASSSPLPTLDSLPLWFLIKHSRCQPAMHRLWALDEHWGHICELIGTRWVVLGGPNLMDSWSFRHEVRRVALLPSFFLCAEAEQRYRKALHMWPQASIVCYAPRNSPCLRAFQRMLTSHDSVSQTTST